ncbi:sushi domain-containing protein 2-like isoform X2 [Stylophora pistillata]|uniref:sushi domain-containing protein 2-like isoform X2 n=1 Tax=Stylophora pistillata TaxID=50429 RepID=UPI000C0434CB|nr:sushi domain-containing protein 2-like isoform X2 [Stylophora pistillata]
MKTVEVVKILVLLAFYNILLSKAVVLPNFYPFGVSEGDQLVPTNDDGSSGKIPISIPFPFFDENQNSLFVNTNGVISFLVQVSQYTPDSFPLGNDRRLVAPFWADVDTRNGGQVFYRETTDLQLLKRATNDVTAAFVDHRKFKATWLFVATWYKVAFYGASNYSHKRNTFQAILITNGRHSFVIYNYNKITWTTGTASSGNQTGLGGTQAQAGFNAGDGKRFYTIQGSGSHDVINLPNKSNVARPGRWVFRIDNAKIEEGGCNTKGSIVISPDHAIMLGGDNILMSGPCFKPSDHITCEFSGGKATNGSYISPIQASCTIPLLYLTGRLAINMSVNGGRSFDFQGIITIVNIVKFKPRVVRHMAKKWIEQSQVRITWDPAYLGDENQKVTVQLARFSTKGDGQVVFHSTFTVVAGQENTGTSMFIVPKGEGQGAIVGDGRFVTLVMVKRNTGNFSTTTQAEWIWSDLFHWVNYELAGQRCMHWYNKEPDPNIYTDTLLPCPQTFLQAMADRGRFMSDEYCNPDARQHCAKYHKGAMHCFRTNNPSEKGAGQKCCYNEHGNLMIGPKNGGSLDRIHIRAGIPVFSHYFNDLLPYSDCCLFSENCGKYFEKRPSDNGTNYEPPRPATGIGDPHMITFDGVEYTFNGYGEYQILQVAPSGFKLQGRMQPLISIDGNKTRGTVYKAFAMKENGSDVVQVHINGRSEVDVLVNGALMEFDSQMMVDLIGVTVLKYNNSYKYSTIFNSGISVTIEKADDLLQMMLLVPQMYKGNTSGLLGFWDGDRVKEFLLPNGTFLDTNSTQSRVYYEFGQKWVTTEEDSLFTYDYGENHSSFVDVGYEPIFLDQDLVFDNVILGQQARIVCGDSRQCLFDIYNTGKVSIGMNSKKSLESFVAVVNEIETPGCIPMENELRNGSAQRNDSKDGAMVFRFSCDTGFSLIGPTEISCYRGQWNGSKPSCQPSGCISIENELRNGSMQINNSKDGAMLFRFSCDTGFSLIGPTAIRCYRGQWNGSKPRCQPSGCISIEKGLRNGSMQINDSKDGAMLFRFSCDTGFSLIGPTVISCYQGQWNGSKPRCQPSGCISIEKGLRNGSMQINDSKDGAMLFRFSCDTGFSLIGPSAIRCYRGQWNGSKPRCQPSGMKESWKLSYVLASAAAGIVFVAVVIVAFCYIRQRGNSGVYEAQEASQNGQKVKENFTYINPAYVSCSDLKSARK